MSDTVPACRQRDGLRHDTAARTCDVHNIPALLRACTGSDFRLYGQPVPHATGSASGTLS